MDGMNVNLIIFLSALIVLVLFGGLYILLGMVSGARKQTRERLSKMKDRFEGGETKQSDPTRAIKSIQESGGLDQLFLNLMPRKEALQNRLSRAGYDIELSKYGLFVFGVLIFVMALFLVAGLKFAMALMLAVIISVGVPHMWVGRAINSRREKFIKQFPEALDLMVRGLKSGLPVNDCIISVGREVTAPTGPEFARVSDEIRLGKTPEEALWEASDRLEINDFKFFVISLSVQRETGGNLGETLENLSKILRSRQAMKLKIRAMSSEAKASAWIVGLLPFIMFGLVMMLNYDYGVQLLTVPQAQVAAIGGLVWMGLGIFVMAKMIDFEV